MMSLIFHLQLRNSKINSIALDSYNYSYELLGWQETSNKRGRGLGVFTTPTHKTNRFQFFAEKKTQHGMPSGYYFSKAPKCVALYHNTKIASDVGHPALSQIRNSPVQMSSSPLNGVVHSLNKTMMCAINLQNYNLNLNLHVNK